MRIIKVKDYDELSEKTALLLASQIQLKPDCVLGLATGSTPIGTYEKLVEWYKQGKLDFSNINTVNLDEYIGLNPDNDQSYRYFMNEHLLSKVNVNLEHTHVPSGIASDIQAECKSYDQMIQSLGGIDLQLLGIGNNGHIGFNEPSDSFIEGTHTVQLNPTTIQANARFFPDITQVPQAAITMGMGGIMKSRKIVLIANGQEKAEIIKKAVEGNITPQIPASILQLHPDCTIIYCE